MNPYQILGVSPDDDEAAIKKAYRKAAKECHPDTHPGDSKAEERFKEIGAAYRILIDKQKRREYDEKAATQKERKSSAGSRKSSTAGRAPIDPLQFEKEFEAFFSVGDPGAKKSKENAQKINPMDVSDLFERYMGFKH